MSEYKKGMFVCGGSESHWQATNAKTIIGAKRIATATYQIAVGGKIEVAEVDIINNQLVFNPVAVKYGYDNWQSAY